MLTTVALIALLAPIALALSTPVKRQSVTTLTMAQVDAFTPYSHYAAAAYCSAAQTVNWACGPLCEARPDFEVQASGGDGDATQYWYVGYDPSLGEVIVAHQGTDTNEIEADLTDADIILGTLDTSLFPGISSFVEVHEGFRNEQKKTAASVLSAVKSVMATKGTSIITVTGHSLGAALSLLDSVYLSLNLGPSTTVKYIGYGLPRVGNQGWADYVDANIDATHVNNKEDYIPILPGRFLGYVHPSGEIHITDSGAWESCPGQDNQSSLCTAGDVSNIFEGSENDHDGPYNGIYMGSKAAGMCT